MGVPSAVEALQVLARSEAAVHRDDASVVRQVEVYTYQGLLTLHWHEPAGEAQPAAIVACGGAMGGTLGPEGNRSNSAIAPRSTARRARIGAPSSPCPAARSTACAS